MKFGLPLAVLNPSIWDELAVLADELGFESIWLPEHLVLPIEMGGSPHDGQSHPPIPSHTPVYDALAYLTWFAAKTANIHLGTYVYNLALRHPFVAARAAATVQQLSQGRLELGVGVGWLEAEWHAAQLDFASRGARADEAIEVCKRLWTEKEVEHHGRFYDFDAVAFEPKPTPPPRLHIGGDGPAALRRAATVGDGWIPMNHTFEQAVVSIAKIAELREANGTPGRCEITLAGGSITSPADYRKFEDAGVDRLIVRPWTSTKDALDGMRRFAEEVIHA